MGTTVVHEGFVRHLERASSTFEKGDEGSLAKFKLLHHASTCRNPSCRVCHKLRLRIWQRKNPLFGVLLDADAYPILNGVIGLGDLAGQVTQALRDGADVHVRAPMPWPGDPGRIPAPLFATPLELAESLRKKGKAHEQSPAWLVLRAAEPWSPETHHLFPAEKRERAVSLLFIGVALAYSGRFGREEQAIAECWRACVLPHAL